MATQADNLVLLYAEAFGRNFIDKRDDRAELRPLFDAIYDRTANEDAAELSDVFGCDDRKLRRMMQNFRDVLEEICKHSDLLYVLTVDETKPGFHTEAMRRSRHKFVLRPNLRLRDFYLRKWWSSLFPNIPSPDEEIADRRPPVIVYPTLEDDKGSVRVAQGDHQLVKRLSKSLALNGVDCEDVEASLFTTNPDEPDRDLILTGNALTNHAIDEAAKPATLPLRCVAKGIAGGKHEWLDGAQGLSRTVYALVTACRSKLAESRRLWLFEAMHDRALDAVSRYFADPRRVEALAHSMNLAPADQFPEELQLVFAVKVNSQNQLLGGDGEIKLVHSCFEPKSAPPMPPARQEAAKHKAPVISMKRAAR